jgi:hypothetical protein
VQRLDFQEASEVFPYASEYGKGCVDSGITAVRLAVRVTGGQVKPFELQSLAMEEPQQERQIDPNFDLQRLSPLYEIYRDYMKHEDDLLNHRTTWLLVIQGFLFATLGVLGEWQLPGNSLDILYTERHWLVYVLGFVGVSIAVAAFASILAANRAIDSLHGQWKALRRKHGNPDWDLLPELAGGGHPTSKKLGKAPTLCIPVVVVIAWIIVSSMAAKDYIYPRPGSGVVEVRAVPQMHVCGEPITADKKGLTRKELIREMGCSLENVDGLDQQLQERFGVKLTLVHISPTINPKH